MIERILIIQHNLYVLGNIVTFQPNILIILKDKFLEELHYLRELVIFQGPSLSTGGEDDEAVFL